MSSDLFKWNSFTADLQPTRKTAIKKNKKPIIEAWLHDSHLGSSEDYKGSRNANSEEDGIDAWLSKVRKAADVATADVELSARVAENSLYTPDTNITDDASSMFSKIIANYIPDYDKNEDSKQIPMNSLLLDDKYDTVTEAKSILNSWLEKKTQIDNEELFFNNESQITEKPTSASSEALSTHREIEQAMHHLRSVPVEQHVMRQVKGKKIVKNPVLSMAARQQQVKERRQKLEEEKVAKMKGATERKAVRANAERVLQEEQVRKVREAKLEEDKIQQEMVALRKQLREEQQQRILSYERERDEQTEAHKADLAAEYRTVVMQSAQEEAERKRILSTRHILLKQLQEAEKKEMKERFSLLQQSFTAWRERTLDSRVSVNKAVAIYQWKSQLRCWNRWRKFCKREEEKRIEKVKEAVFRENKHNRVAEIHYQKSHVRHYFHYWLHWTKHRVQDKEEKQQEMKRKMLMQQCLASAAEVSRQLDTDTADDVKTNIKESGGNVINYDSSKYNKSKRLGINFDKKRVIMQDTCTVTVTKESEPTLTKLPDESAVTSQRQDSGNHHRKGSTAQPKPSKDMNQIPLNPWDMPLQANTGHAPIRRTVENKQHKTPAALKGMEDRARLRRERQEEIQRRKEEKKRLAELAKIEEVNKKAEEERQLKLAEKEKRLKELVKAKELERFKQEEIQLTKDNTLKAINHYHNNLKRNIVLKSLKSICEKTRQHTEKAEAHYNKSLAVQCWRTWQTNLEIKVLEKEEHAIQFYRVSLIRKAFSGLKRSLTLQDSYTRIAVRHYKRVLRIRVLRAWAAQADADKMRRAELEIRAVELEKRSCLRNHLLSWRRVTPELVREKEAELRKAKMRSIILDILPDYTPPGS